MRFGRSVSANLFAFANFEGRASRSEFWWFYLFTALAYVAASVVDAVFIGFLGRQAPYFVFGMMVAVLLFVPTAGLAWRRLHDIGLPGWVNLPWLVFYVVWVLYAVSTIAFPSDYDAEADIGISLIFLMVFLPYLVMYLIPSNSAENLYGKVPE